MQNALLEKAFLKQTMESILEVGSYAALGYMVAGVPGTCGSVAFCLVLKGTSFLVEKANEHAIKRIKLLDVKIAQFIFQMIGYSIAFHLASTASVFCGFQMTWISGTVIPLVAAIISKGIVSIAEHLYQKVIKMKAKGQEIPLQVPTNAF